MRLAYNKDGFPYLIDDDETVYDFSPVNSGFLLAELSTNKSLLDELFNKIKNSINERFKEYENKQKEDFLQLDAASAILTNIAQLSSISKVCSDAEEMYYQNITPKPFETWRWNKIEKDWEPLTPIPFGEIGERYTWSDHDYGWVPVQPSPEPEDDFYWSELQHKWMPKMPYPVDAAPEEFIWDLEERTWILNNR